MQPPASLAHLQVFLAVARHRSFSAAARELRVSTSAVSHTVKLLEEQLRVVLLTRTTRSVSPTDAGRRLVEGAAPGLEQALATMTEVSAQPGEVVGRVRLSVGQIAVPLVLKPLLPKFRARYPHVEVEIAIDERLVDIVADGFDAGVRLTDSIERDMVQVRLTKEFRFVVVGSPGYLARHGTPQRPEDLLKHDCITFRSTTNGSLYAWELERGRRSWRVPVRGGIVADAQFAVTMVEEGLGLTYTTESAVAEQLRDGRLKVVLDAYASKVAGLFLYYPSRKQSSPALRRFVEVAKEGLARG